MSRINNKHLRLIAVTGLVLVSALLAACSGTPANEQQGTTSQDEKPAASGPMTLKVLEPVEGAEVTAGTLKVAIETTGIEFVMPSNDLVAGQGHVHYTLDDGPEIMSIDKVTEIKDVEPGTHTLKAFLVQNNTEPYEPLVEQVIEFTAK